MSNRLIAALTSLAATSACACAALAAASDYTFEAISPQVKNSPAAEIAVRLVHKPSGKKIDNALVFRSRLDMSPENMAEHQGAVEPLPASEPGVYRFKAELSMAGKWALKLMAKVPGETETIEGSVVIDAKD